jgi:hypothetical protein
MGSTGTVGAIVAADAEGEMAEAGGEMIEDIPSLLSEPPNPV